MRRGDAAFEPHDVENAGGEVDLAPFHAAKLADAQTVTPGDEDHRRIAMSIATPLARRNHKQLDLGRRQILARAAIDVALPARRLADHPKSNFCTIFAHRRLLSVAGVCARDVRICAAPNSTYCITSVPEMLQFSIVFDSSLQNTLATFYGELSGHLTMEWKVVPCLT